MDHTLLRGSSIAEYQIVKPLKKSQNRYFFLKLDSNWNKFNWGCVWSNKQFRVKTKKKTILALLLLLLLLFFNGQNIDFLPFCMTNTKERTVLMIHWMLPANLENGVLNPLNVLVNRWIIGNHCSQTKNPVKNILIFHPLKKYVFVSEECNVFWLLKITYTL